jgi:uncharacterized membrane protein
MYWFTGLLGIAMAIAPFVQGYQDNPMAMWTSIILGGVVAVASILEGMDMTHAKWEWWVAGIAGILGAVIVIAAGYEVFFVEQPV